MAEELVGRSVEGCELGGGIGRHRGWWLVDKQRVGVYLRRRTKIQYPRQISHSGS